jgi:hypothetical protein
MVSQFQITQTFGQISIQQDHGGVRIQQPEAKMEINTKNPLISMDRAKGKLEIDQSKAWSALGIMNPLKLNSKLHSQIRGKFNQTIAEIAQAGDRLAAIHKSTNVISELAKESTRKSYKLDYTGEASNSNVDISFTSDKLNINLIEGTVTIHIEAQQPLIERVPAKTLIGMERYPAINIDWLGKNIDYIL